MVKRGNTQSTTAQPSPSKEVVKPVEKTEQPRTVTISIDDLDALIEKKIKERGPEVIYQAAPYDPTDIRSLAASTLYDKEDVLQEPAVFFSHKFGHGFISDTRSGKEFPNPIGNRAIIFKLWQTEKGGTVNDPTIIHICRYATSSKKEAEWMRSHSCYGIDFYEYSPDVEEIDMSQESIRIEAGERLKRMNDSAILSMTKEYQGKNSKVKVMERITDMRTNLIPVMMQIVKKEEDQRRVTSLNETLRHSKVVGSGVEV